MGEMDSVVHVRLKCTRLLFSVAEVNTRGEGRPEDYIIYNQFHIELCVTGDIISTNNIIFHSLYLICCIYNTYL